MSPWTVTRRVPLSMEIYRQEYWSELPFFTPGDLSDPGIKPVSLVSSALACRFFPTVLAGRLQKHKKCDYLYPFKWYNYRVRHFCIN